MSDKKTKGQILHDELFYKKKNAFNEKTKEELVDSEIKKPSLSSGGLSQITEMMREIVRKEQRKQTEEIKKRR